VSNWHKLRMNVAFCVAITIKRACRHVKQIAKLLYICYIRSISLKHTAINTRIVNVLQANVAQTFAKSAEYLYRRSIAVQ